ncbi:MULTISPECIES: hypothetical protein [Nocardia]|uniref:DUF3040 domain-containing protein n=1 Tax=Nocardia sputorum TaxID=2984338 RepID=A0ABM8CVH5_9NOCA|nr:hypothetical protein [Nocardia sputorum]BDT90348.1 hypothetical protein IFM12275_03240 [Nocardia sputorum]BDT98968.1 hypothetical protein IFM12276_19970 [Nocardia sputorum]
MTNPGFSSWQAQQNASRNAARHTDWARQSTADAHRLSRRAARSSGWRVGNILAALLVLAILVVAAPFVLAVLAHVGI